MTRSKVDPLQDHHPNKEGGESPDLNIQDKLIAKLSFYHNVPLVTRAFL